MREGDYIEGEETMREGDYNTHTHLIRRRLRRKLQSMLVQGLLGSVRLLAFALRTITRVHLLLLHFLLLARLLLLVRLRFLPAGGGGGASWSGALRRPQRRPRTDITAGRFHCDCRSVPRTTSYACALQAGWEAKVPGLDKSSGVHLLHSCPRGFDCCRTA